MIQPKKKIPETALYLLLTLMTVVSGYIYLRYAYKVTDTMPFTQEIILIILGTMTTIFITALLLQKQTTVEMQKEQNLKFFDLKVRTYESLFDLLEQMSTVQEFEDSDILRLRFITHRLAVISSPDVLEEFGDFLEVIKATSKDQSFVGDNATLDRALSKLTLSIRDDLVGRDGRERSHSEIRAFILENSELMTDIENQ